MCRNNTTRTRSFLCAYIANDDRQPNLAWTIAIVKPALCPLSHDCPQQSSSLTFPDVSVVHHILLLLHRSLALVQVLVVLHLAVVQVAQLCQADLLHGARPSAATTVVSERGVVWYFSTTLMSGHLCDIL